METRIEKQLESVIELYSCVRGVGHTKAVVEGAKAQGAVVVVSNERMKPYINSISSDTVSTVSISSLEKLRGSNKPVVFDNDVILSLSQNSLSEIKHLKKIIGNLNEKLKQHGFTGIYN